MVVTAQHTRVVIIHRLSDGIHSAGLGKVVNSFRHTPWLACGGRALIVAPKLFLNTLNFTIYGMSYLELCPVLVPLNTV